MINTLFSLFDRAKDKWLCFYRLCVFRAKTGQRAEGCTILGKLTLINPNIQIGKNVTFYPDVMLFGDGIIQIGDNVDIGNNVIIYAKNPAGGVTIGNNSMIAAHSYIIDSNHGTQLGVLMREQPLSTEPINIGSDVWIAAGCKILKGATIKDGAIIGAGSIVNSTIAENAIAVGCPAHEIKKRPHQSCT